jgi:hypothetical protein
MGKPLTYARCCTFTLLWVARVARKLRTLSSFAAAGRGINIVAFILRPH